MKATKNATTKTAKTSTTSKKITQREKDFGPISAYAGVEYNRNGKVVRKTATEVRALRAWVSIYRSRKNIAAARRQARIVMEYTKAGFARG